MVGKKKRISSVTFVCDWPPFYYLMLLFSMTPYLGYSYCCYIMENTGPVQVQDRVLSFTAEII